MMRGHNNETTRGDGLTARPDYGALVISLDFELHWGVRDHHSADGAYRENLLGARGAIPRMLDAFERYDIATTWATVGFLFAESRRERERFSPSVRPQYANPALSPYHEVTGDTEADDPLHYAPSLIDAIAKRPRQEIGAHTFSHYYCLEPGQTREAFQADLRSAGAIARARGFNLRSLIFPRNQVNPAYTAVLRDCGIICYRGNEQGWMYRASAADGERGRLIMNARRADRYLNLSGGTLTAWDDITRDDGLCNIPASRFLNPYNPRLRHLDPLRLRRIIRDLRAAAVRKRVYHLWWHPHNFGTYTDENMAFLERILEEFARLKESHGMRSLNMEDVSTVCSSSGMRDSPSDR
ncbi:MAG: polysaccharide deacetylase family protein [Chloroflexi bacterium]|nr:polysaccharide deacetylase family protein [Chloroflexota bacterium]